ncbi:MAG: HAD-IA family hydrolase [Thermoplasmata archaeon]|nr:HAD-IA family hydrolase [Thermoplasmata archaeon]
MKDTGKGVRAVLFDVDSTFYSYPLMALILIWKYWPFIPFNAVLMLVRRRLRKMGLQGDFRSKQAEMFSRYLHIPKRWGERYLDYVVYRHWNQNFAHVPPRKGLREFLDFLVENGIAIGIISDYPPEAKVRQLGLWDYPWELMIDCEREGALKPDTHAFEKAIDRLQLPPEKVMYVGDKYRCDVRAPASIGMKTAWLTWRRKSGKGPEPDIYFRNFRDLMIQFKETFGSKNS